MTTMTTWYLVLAMGELRGTITVEAETAELAQVRTEEWLSAAGPDYVRWDGMGEGGILTEEESGRVEDALHASGGWEALACVPAHKYPLALTVCEPRYQGSADLGPLEEP